MRTVFRSSKKKYSVRRTGMFRRLFRLHKHPAFFVPVLTFSVLLLVVVVALLVFGRGQNPIPQLSQSDSKIAIVNVDKTEQFVPTRAQTVGELLIRLDITLNEGDVVEPALDTKIVSDNFRVNVYRALPITIVDGDKEIRALSAAATPRSIVRQVGIDAHPEDEFIMDPAEDFVSQGVIGQRLTVKRATVVNVTLYGTKYEMRTQAKTVSEFLEEKGIALQPGETVQPGVGTPISSDVPIFVNRKNITVETTTEEIPFSTKYIEDTSLTFGVQAVRQQGVPGRRVVTYQVDVTTGERTKFHEITVRRPVQQIVVRGAYINIPSDKQGVMAAAGIRQSDYMYVDFIISRESTWNAAARNPSSGAYGLCQALPGSKMASAGSDWETNAVTQLRWCDGYAQGRYGSWAAAYNFWSNNHWW